MEYLDSHVVSTKFAIFIALLSSHRKNSNHPVTGSIIVAEFICKFSLFTLHPMMYVPIRYTQILFYGISSASLACNLPYFYFIVLYVGNCHNYLLTSGIHL